MFEDLNPPDPITKPQDIPGWVEPERKGLGDKIEKIAKPIARVIDRVAKTNIQNCSACEKRRKKLNNMFPDKETP